MDVRIGSRYFSHGPVARFADSVPELRLPSQCLDRRTQARLTTIEQAPAQVADDLLESAEVVHDDGGALRQRFEDDDAEHFVSDRGDDRGNGVRVQILQVGMCPTSEKMNVGQSLRELVQPGLVGALSADKEITVCHRAEGVDQDKKTSP